MMAGFGTGPLFSLPADSRKKTFLRIGLAALALFVLVRFINIYGDPVLWSTRETAVYTFLSFMNVTKYPPSLLFCLVTLGIMCLMIAAAEHSQNRLTNIAGTYGKVPLFYFVVHFYIIHCILIVLLLCQGFRLADLEFASGTFGRPKGRVSGIPLWAVYLLWITVVAVLYQPCLWFGRYKAAHKHWWLRYV